MLQRIKHLDLEQKIGWREIMNHKDTLWYESYFMIMAALNLKCQWYGHIYVIIVMHKYFLVEM